MAGLNDKTSASVERTGLFISRKTIEALLAVPVLNLSWADVGQEMLEENPTEEGARGAQALKTAAHLSGG